MLDLQRLKAERIAKGLTQTQMAEKLGFKERTPYAKRENGIVGIGANELKRIAEILEIDDLSIFFKLNVPKREQKEEVK